MKNKLKKLLICFISLIIGIFCLIVLLNRIENLKTIVPGTVFAKNECIKTHRKTTNIYSEFLLAIHPDDTTKYKDYVVNANFATWSKLDIGDHTQFSVLKRDVEKQYKNTWEFIIDFILTIGFGVCLIYILYNLIILPFDEL